MTCASTVDPIDFPINVLSGTFDFGDLCQAKTKMKEAKMVEA